MFSTPQTPSTPQRSEYSRYPNSTHFSIPSHFTISEHVPSLRAQHNNTQQEQTATVFIHEYIIIITISSLLKHVLLIT